MLLKINQRGNSLSKILFSFNKSPIFPDVDYKKKT